MKASTGWRHSRFLCSQRKHLKQHHVPDHAKARSVLLSRGDWRPDMRLHALLRKSFDGFFLILLFHLLRPLKALLISLLAIPVLALVCSLISFASFSRWAYFAPVLLGVLVFELYDDYRRKWIPRVYEDIAHMS